MNRPSRLPAAGLARLALFALAAALCGLIGSCSTPILRPEAQASILASRGIAGEKDGSGAAAVNAPGDAAEGGSGGPAAGSPAGPDEGAGGAAGSRAAVVIRIAVKGSLAVERFGITVKVRSSTRDYWRTEILEEHIPPGGSATVEMKVDFDSGKEVYKEGSAVIDASWFE